MVQYYNSSTSVQKQEDREFEVSLELGYIVNSKSYEETVSQKTNNETKTSKLT